MLRSLIWSFLTHLNYRYRIILFTSTRVKIQKYSHKTGAQKSCTQSFDLPPLSSSPLPLSSPSIIHSSHRIIVKSIDNSPFCHHHHHHHHHRSPVSYVYGSWHRNRGLVLLSGFTHLDPHNIIIIRQTYLPIISLYMEQ